MNNSFDPNTEPIELDARWLDPFVERLCSLLSDEGQASVECLIKTSPSMALALLNVSKGHVFGSQSHWVWLLKHRADAITTNVRYINSEWSTEVWEDKTFIFSHPHVRDSLVQTTTDVRFDLDYLEEIDTFTPMTHLQALSLSLSISSHETLSLTGLSTLTALRSLWLEWSPMADVVTPTSLLEPLSTLRGLTSLTLYGFFDLDDQAFLQLGDALTGLRSLSMAGCKVEGAFFNDVPTLQTSLTKLVGESLSAQSFYRCTGLQEIKIDDKLVNAAGPNLFMIYPALKTATSIQVFSRSFLERLVDYRKPIGVKSMQLSYRAVNPKALQAFMFVPYLNRLDLRGVMIDPAVTQDDLRHLSALTSLTRLDIGYTVMPPEGVRILPHIQASLRELLCDKSASCELAQDSAQLAFALSLTRLDTSDIHPSLLARFTNLRDLEIRAPLPHHTYAIAPLTKLTSMKLKFKKESPPLSADHVSALVSVSKRLRKLALNLRLTQDAFQGPFVGGLLAQCKMLERLELDCNVRQDPHADSERLTKELSEFPQSWRRALIILPELWRIDGAISLGNQQLYSFMCLSREMVMELLEAGPCNA